MISRMRRFYFSLLIGSLVLAMAGCASTGAYRGTTGNVIGSWKFKDQNFGPQVLTFRDDGIYEVDYDGDGEKDIWGSYRISRDWLFLNDLGGDFIFDCGQDGAYTYRVKNDIMTFMLMADQCPSRQEAMDVERVKIHKILPPVRHIRI